MAISKPLAAYHLGLLSHTIRMWREVFWYCPDEFTAHDGVPLAVEKLRQARVELADVMPPNVFGELGRVLDAIDEQAAAMIRAWEADDDSFASWAPALTGETNWKNLRSLADQAIGNASALRPWFDLGAAVGSCQAYVQDCAHELIERFGDIERLLVHKPMASREILPCLKHVADAARFLPKQTLAMIPVLSDLVRRLPAHGDALHPDSSAEFLTGDRHGLRLVAEPGFNLANANMFVDQIDQSIQEVAGQAVLPTLSTPQWDGDRSRLLMDGKVIRTVSRLAKNVVQILRAFEDDGWPDRIDDPITGPEANQPTRLHEAIRSLNNGLTMIRFRSDGTGTGIEWKPI